MVIIVILSIIFLLFVLVVAVFACIAALNIGIVVAVLLRTFCTCGRKVVHCFFKGIGPRCNPSIAQTALKTSHLHIWMVQLKLSTRKRFQFSMKQC